MANYCYVKNYRKTSPKEVLDLIKNELESKFNLTVLTTYLKENNYLEIKIGDIEFPFFINNDKFEFYDVPHTALNKSSDCSYKEAINELGPYYDIASCYSFIYEYIKNFLAKYQETELQSDGAGDIPAFDRPHRLESFSSWFNYYKELLTQDKKINKVFFKKSFKKSLKVDQSFFPELTKDLK